MKNYKFVFGLLLSSMLSTGAQAVSIVQNTDANRGQMPVVADGAGPAQAARGGHSILVNVSLTNRAGTGFRQRSVDSVATASLDHVLSYASLPTAFYYSDTSASPVQSLRAETKMAQQAAALENVSEPASELLLLAGLSALAIAVRRQSPS